jgi:hypothetical protein
LITSHVLFPCDAEEQVPVSLLDHSPPCALPLPKD